MLANGSKSCPLDTQTRHLHNKGNRVCLLIFVRALPAGSLPMQLWGLRVCPMLSSLLAVRQHFPGRYPIGERGESRPQGYTFHHADKWFEKSATTLTQPAGFGPFSVPTVASLELHVLFFVFCFFNSFSGP